ncbi:MAG: SRPBCC family protein [Aestuariivirgaceae bacterium]
MSDPTITKTVFFNASRKTVWSFLTDKDKLAQWFHPAEADLADGEDYALTAKADDGSTTRICWGTVLQWQPPEKLVCSFTVKPLGAQMTTVIWSLEEVHGGTRLTLEHKGIGAAADEAALQLLMALDAGWDRHFATLRTLMG